MPQKRIAIYGGSFNPPGIHHKEVVQALIASFDEVIVVPCGPRPDKEITNDIALSHRATMTDLAFGDMKNVEVDLFDLENECFTPNIDLQARYAHRGIVHHVIGSDLIGPRGSCPVRDCWKDGESLWQTAQFVIAERAEYVSVPESMPMHHEIIQVPISGSSSAIRKYIFDRKSIEHLVPPRVAEYIRRYGLYRMSMPSETSRLALENPTVSHHRDERNERAVLLSDSMTLPVSEDANLIMVFGGDGTMLRAIKSEWRRRIPFYGVNVGHVGFLLNETDNDSLAENFSHDLVVHRVPLLSVEMEMLDGTIVHELAFNDAYVQNVDQAAWVKIHVDGIVRTERMIADTVLISSPAGSTAYARAMGATPMLLGQKGLVLAASAVNAPFGWRPVHLPESTVVLETIDPDKRPAIGKVDGKSFGPVLRMTVRVSRTASAELAFKPDADLDEKRIAIQFPKR